MWTVTKAKLAGPARVWSAFSLGRNEYGTWLYATAGTEVRTSDGELFTVLDLGGAQLIPPGAWWTAWWWEDDTITIDITSPCVIDGRKASYTDLEIDLWATRRGDHGIVDVDEYDTARAAGLISDDQDGRVRQAVADLDDRLDRGAEPFGDIGWSWLSGVTRNRVDVVAYDPDWPRRFDAVRERLLPQLPTGSRVEHVGSTAVPGLAAKDVIDIAVVVPSGEELDVVVDRLQSIGYQARPAAFADDPGHVFLRKLDDGRRAEHLHLYLDHNANLAELIAVRDLLRTDATARQRYQDLKLSLAAANPYDRGAYVDGKNDTVRSLLRLATRDGRQPT